MTTYSIRQAAEKLGLGEMRVRTLLREGRLEGTKAPIEGSDVQAWHVTEDAIEAYLANKSSGGSTGARNLSQRTYKIKVPTEHNAAVAEFLGGLGISLDAANNYDPEKSKAYRNKRAAAQRAAKAAANADQSGDLDGDL